LIRIDHLPCPRAVPGALPRSVAVSIRLRPRSTDDLRRGRPLVRDAAALPTFDIAATDDPKSKLLDTM